MSSYNIRMNAANYNKLNELSLATSKPTRQGGIASVLSAATNAKFYQGIADAQGKEYTTLKNAHRATAAENKNMAEVIHIYRCVVVGMAIVITMALIL